MSSAVTEAATWETSVIGPDGTDLISAAGVRTGLQDLANRTKWLKESLFDIQTFSGILSNNTSSTTYAAVHASAALTFTNVEISDRIILLASVPIFSANGIPRAFVRWHDAAASIGDSETMFEVASSGGATVLVLGQKTIAADAGSYVCTLQWKVETATTTEVELSSTTPILLYGVRLKFGTT